MTEKHPTRKEEENHIVAHIEAENEKNGKRKFHQSFLIVLSISSVIALFGTLIGVTYYSKREARQAREQICEAGNASRLVFKTVLIRARSQSLKGANEVLAMRINEFYGPLIKDLKPVDCATVARGQFPEPTRERKEDNG